MDVQATTALFERVPIFAGLTPEALQYLAENASCERWEAGALIVEEGASGNAMFVIESGRVDVIKARCEPSETRLATLSAHDFFGEMSLLECQPRSASVVAVEATATHALTGGDLFRLFQRHPDQYAIVILNVARDLARRLRKLGAEFVARRGEEQQFGAAQM